MELILSNPTGLFALLGLPAILAIHFLQRQSQEIPISTLFLLEQMQRESVEGSRFEKLRGSVPLWLQLLMVLLLTWLLVQPRWLRNDSIQPIAVILDSSASMSAFQEKAEGDLLRELADLSNSVARTEYYVMESSLEKGNLYRGTELEPLAESLGEWTPALGLHDMSPALRVGRSLVGPTGIVILVTDHEQEDLPFDARLLAIGEPRPNLGFAGLRVAKSEGDTPPQWTAVVRNYSEQAVQRQYYLTSEGRRSEAQTISLGPNEIRSITGPFPPDVKFCTLELEPDDFTPDDILPMIAPLPRQLVVRVVTGPAMEQESARVAAALGNTLITGPDDEANPDVILTDYDPLNPSLPETNAIIFLSHQLRQDSILAGQLIAENHALMKHLNWQPLIVRRTLQIPMRDTDLPLLWQDEKPLIILREESDGARQLIFNFDLQGSNALRLPAFIVLVHRFSEMVRARKPALERRVMETDQSLASVIPARPGDTPFTFSFQSWDGQIRESQELLPAELVRQNAPRQPGFLTVRRGSNEILEASTWFADTREADLRNASSANKLDGLDTQLVERHTEVDGNWKLWVLLLALVLLVSWGWIAWRQSRIQMDEAIAAAMNQSSRNKQTIFNSP